MLEALSSYPQKIKFSRFDGLVMAILLGMALFTGLWVWRGDRIGVQVLGVSPANEAAELSTRTDIRVTFDQPMLSSASDLPLALTPPVSGAVRWEENTLIFSPDAPLEPETLYTVTLAADLEGQRGRSLQTPLTWQFRTRQSRLLYIAPDASEQDQIFSINLAGDERVQLTREAFGIFDYALSPDAGTIAYSALRQDGGSDLWAVAADGGERSSLLMCPEAVCSGVAWMPNSERLIYERRVMLVPGAAPGPPRLWWLSLRDGETVAVFEDNQIIGYGAAWSPNGQWLSYIAPSSQGIQVYNINDGQSLVIPNRMGGAAVWGPRNESLLVSDVLRTDRGFTVHLLKAAPGGGELVDISGQDEQVEDGAPAWSPDGAWLAFTRKVAGSSMGKQIWLMRPDGSEARALTSEPEMHHGLPAWSPGGRYLAFQRFALKELGAQPSIWLFDLESEEMRELVTPGNRPTWLP